MSYDKDKLKRKRMRSLTIKEISGVDKPAVEPGVVDVILKRADLDAPADKAELLKNMGAPALTSAVDGHSHLLDIALPAGHTTWDGQPDGHTHPFVVQADGSVAIGEADGHTHEVAAVTKAAAAGGGSNNTSTEATMAQDPTKTAGNDDKTAAENAKLQTELALAKAFGSLTDAGKKHFEGLDEAGRTAFLGKSAAERDAILADIAKGNAVVYKAKDGTEYRASDDPRTVALAKRLDEQVETSARERVERFESEIRKRAESELKHLPGDLNAKVALLKAAESISDPAQRTAAVAALHAQNEAMAKAMTTIGASGGSGDEGSASAELDNLAKARASKDGVDFYTAYERVSNENPSLVTKALAGR